MRDERQLLFSESLGGWMGWGGLNVSQNMFIKAVGGTSMLACWVIRSKECVVCVFGCWYLLEMLDTADGPVLLLPVVIIPSSPSHPRSSKNNKTQDYLMKEAAV